MEQLVVRPDVSVLPPGGLQLEYGVEDERTTPLHVSPVVLRPCHTLLRYVENHDSVGVLDELLAHQLDPDVSRVDVGDTVSLAVPDYDPFIENPDFEGVRKGTPGAVSEEAAEGMDPPGTTSESDTDSETGTNPVSGFEEGAAEGASGDATPPDSTGSGGVSPDPASGSGG